jgi:hypothetical protein
MHKLTHQEIFTKAVAGVIRQGRLAMNQDACKYRMEIDGQRCACGVGQLIDDDLYSPAIEGVGAYAADPTHEVSGFNDERGEPLMLALLFSGVGVTEDATVNLLDEIQAAHDSAANLTDFKRRAQRLADRRGLSMPA